MYRVSSCVLYSLIENYAWIDYLSCQSKTLSRISSNRISEQISFNILLIIGIPELLLNLVSCHGFVDNPNSTDILNYRSRLVNRYSAKVFFVIENNSNQLSSLLNDVKLRIHAIEQLEIDFVIEKKAISSVENTINKLNIQSDLYFIYKKNLSW